MWETTYTGSLNNNYDFGGGGETKEEADETNNKILIFQDLFTMEYPKKYRLNWFFILSFCTAEFELGYLAQ